MENFLSATIGSSSLQYALPENRSERGFLGVSPDSWARALIITGLFAAVFWPNLRRLWLKTNPFFGEPNWSHSVVVPIIGLYYLFVHREELIRAGSRQFVWGPVLRNSRFMAGLVMLILGGGVYALCRTQQSLVASLLHSSIIASMVKSIGEAIGILGALVLLLDWSLGWTLFGLGVFVYGIYPGQNDYFKDLGMVITLFGIVLLLHGPQVMKIAWFPIAFLVCAIPWPGLVYSWVAEPLQTMAATVAVHVLNFTGVDSVVNGTKIVINNFNGKPPRVLNVAEACAGMRSLMTFIAVGGAIAFLSSRPLWQKLIIVVSAIPIAIFCNVMRISGQGLLDHYVSPQWSESFAHQFVGMMMLLPAFFLILGVGWVLDKLFIEEADEDDDGYQVAPKAVAATAGKSANIAVSRTVPSTEAQMPRAAVVEAVVPASPAASPTPSPAAKPVAAERTQMTPAAVRVPTQVPTQGPTQAPAQSPAQSPTQMPVTPPVLAASKPAASAVSPAPAKVAAIPASPRPVPPPAGMARSQPMVPPASQNPRVAPPANGFSHRTGFVPPRQAVPPNAMQNSPQNPAQPRRSVEPPKPSAAPVAPVRRIPPPQPGTAKPKDPQSKGDK